MRHSCALGLRLRCAAFASAILLIAPLSSQAEQLRITGRKPKTIALPGAFAGLEDPIDDSLYTADIGLGEMFSFLVVYDTGASGSMLSQGYADLLEIPETGEEFEDVGIGGTETFDVSVPTRLLLAPATIGEENSETISYYSAYGEHKFQVRQADPVVGLTSISVNIAGTPVLNQSVLKVVPNEISYTYIWGPVIDYMASTLLPSVPGDLPPGALHVPLSYETFVDPATSPVTVADNPLIPNVRVVDDRKPPNEQSEPTDWLLDTGGAVTIVGEDLAAAIGINTVSETPVSSVDVLGVGGDVRTFYGYQVDELIVPMTGGNELIFEDIIVYVPEAGSLPADLPGIFGMNLIGQSFSAQDILGYPTDIIDSPFSEWYVDPFGSELILVGPALVPEPSSLVLLVSCGLALVLYWRRTAG